MPKKTKFSTKNSYQKLFEKYKYLKWLLPLFIIVVILYFVLQKNINIAPTSVQTVLKENNTVSMTNWKTYANSVAKLSIQYPPTWILKETHEISNRVVDNPNEINTATLIGKEGEIIIQWGPMGFGGGCDPKDHRMFQIKNMSMDICDTLHSDGNEYLGGISNNAQGDKITEAQATIYKPLNTNLNSQTVRAILSTLTFN